MIEQQIPLEIQPGLVMNGSKMERAGKWIDGNCVRFFNGIAQPMKGKGSNVILNGGSGQAMPSGGAPKFAYRFWTTDGSHTLVVGLHTKIWRIYSLKSGVYNHFDELTPSGGLADQGDVNSWSFANLGEDFLFTNAGWPTATVNAALWVWPGGSSIATVVDNSSYYRGVFVTPENFMVLVEGVNTLKWASQGTYDVLTPAVGNSAGSLDVPSPYMVISGRALVGESLVWTTGDLWALNYVGGDLIYGLRKVGDACGLLGANNIAITNGVARWMGQGGFFEYDGYVRPLECPLTDYIFGNIARTHAHRFFTVQLPQYNAIQFWYMSGAGSDTCDRFVEYNYANGTWTKGDGFDRAAGAGEWPSDLVSGPTGASATAPIMIKSDYNIYLHEQTGVMTNETASQAPYLESGPVHLDEGRVARVQKIIPDGANGSDTISLFAGWLPQDTEVEQGPNTVTFGTIIDTRFTARYVRYKQELKTVTSRVGVPRIGIIPGGSNR